MTFRFNVLLIALLLGVCPLLAQAPQTTLQQLESKAFVYLYTHRPTDAFLTAQEAAELAKATNGMNSPEFANALTTEAWICCNTEKMGLAETLATRAEALFTTCLASRTPGYAFCNGVLALIAWHNQFPDRAEIYYTRARTIYQSADERIILAEMPWLLSLANSYESYAHLSQALELYQIARTVLLHCSTETDPAYQICIEGICNVDGLLGRYAEAEELRKKLLELSCKNGGELSEAYLGNLYELAQLYRMGDQYALCMAALAQAADISCKLFGKQSEWSAKILEEQAECTKCQRKYADAERLLLSVCSLRESLNGKQSDEYAATLKNLAELYCEMYRFDEAERLLLNAKRINTVNSKANPVGYISCLSSLGNLYDKMGQFSKARSYSEQSLSLLKQYTGEEHIVYASQLVFLAEIERHLGQYPLAEQHYHESLDLQRKLAQGNYTDASLETLINLATLYMDSGQYTHATTTFTEALAIMEKKKMTNKESYANLLNNIAALFLLKSHYEEASDCAKRAQEVYQTLCAPTAPEYINNQRLIAQCTLLTNHLDDAVALASQLADTTRHAYGVNHPQYANSLQLMATVYLYTGQTEKSAVSVEKARNIYQKNFGKLYSHCGTCDDILSQARALSGRYDLAFDTVVRRMSVSQQTLDTIFRASSESAMRDAASMFASDVSILLGFANLSTRSPRIRDTAYTWVLRRKNIVFDAIARMQQMRMLVGRDCEFADNISNYEALRKRLVNMELHPAQDIDPTVRQQELQRSRDELARLEAAINTVVTARYGKLSFSNVTAGDVRKRLPAGSILIDILRTSMLNDLPDKLSQLGIGKPHYFAFVLKANEKNHVGFYDLGEVEEIDRAVQEVRDSMQAAQTALQRTPPDKLPDAERGWDQAYREVAHRLYSLIVSPYADTLAQASTIYFAPDGELNRVALEACVDDAGKYLIERYCTKYLSCGRDLLQEIPTNKASGVEIFAAPDYNADVTTRSQKVGALRSHVDPLTPATQIAGAELTGALRGITWIPLPGTQREATTIAGLLDTTAYTPVDCYLGQDALEDILKARSSPEILHIATHGFFLPDQHTPDPGLRTTLIDATRGGNVARGLYLLRGSDNPLLHSGLILCGANTYSPQIDQKLDDGWLTAEEITTMNLQGTRLVVLSACESGLGDVRCGDGVYGLRRAFQLAGAQSLITSLYQVPDTQTSDLMELFYRGLQRGETIDKAFHQAQLTMLAAQRQKTGVAHPCYWANFVFIGK